MTNPFQPKKIQVPGLLSNDAMQEQMRQFVDVKNREQNAAPPPTSAVEFTDKIMADPGTGVMPEMVRSPNLQKQDRAIDVRSDVLSSIMPTATLGDGGALDTFKGIGAQFARVGIGGLAVGMFGEGSLIGESAKLTPEEQQVEADEQLEQAKEGEAATKAHVDARAKLRGMTDEQAAAMGMPVAPGGTADVQAAAETSDTQILAGAKAKTAEKAKAVGDKAAQPVMPAWLNVIREGYKAAAGTPLAVAKGGLIGWELTGGMVWNMGDLERSTGRAWLDTVEKTLDKMMPGDKARSKDFITQLAQAGGTMSSFMIGGFVGKGLGMAAGAIPAYMGALAGGAEGMEDAERFNAVGVQKYIAFIANSGLGVLEALPIERMFMMAEKSTGGMVSRMLKNTAVGGLTEFIQEFGQAVGHDLVAKGIYDAKRELSLSEWAKQGAIGAIVGSGAAVATQTLQEAGMMPQAPTGAPIDEAQQEAAANFVIDTLQERLDAQFDPEVDEAPGDVGVEAEEAATELMNGEGFDLVDPADVNLAPFPTSEKFTVSDPAFEDFDAGPLDGQEVTLSADQSKAPTGMRSVILPDGTEQFVGDKLLVAAQEPEMLAKVGEEGTATVEGPGGTVPVNENGKVELRHYGKQVLDDIDPAKRGTGPVKGEERARLGGPGNADPDVVDRAYYGVGEPPSIDDQKALQRALREADKLPTRGAQGVFPRFEAQDAAYRKYGRQKGYAGQEGLGDIKHTVEADPATIYNAIEDPLNLRSQIDPAMPAPERATRFERLVKDAGFKGMYYPESKLGQTAMLFEKATPVQVVDKRDGLNRRYEVTDPKTVELDPADVRPLPGLRTSTGPVKTVVQAAKAYASARGLPARRQAEYAAADPERGKRIAEAYENMKHAPNDPKVKAAYQAMTDETLAQYEFVKASGLKIEAIEPGMADPYTEGPKQVLDDLAKGHLWFYPTESGFGSSDTDVSDNPLLAETGETVGDRKLLVNDVFRIVHDFFGHGIEGSGFGARGEENAWQSHMRLYSPAALPAVTSETRGQNSWVNFGPNGEANRKNQKETVYADQKTGIMPDWTWQEGVADDTSNTVDDNDGIYAMRASPADVGPVKGTGKNGLIKIVDVGQAMTDDHMKRMGRQLFPEDSDEDFEIALGLAREELTEQVQRENSGVGWYGKDTQEAIALTSRVFPTLRTEHTHRQLYLTFAGIFSNGATPEQAWVTSSEAFRYFIETGKPPVKRANADGTPAKMTKDGKAAGWSPRNAANEQQLALLNHVIEREGGVEQAMKWLTSLQPRSAINELMTASGLYKEGRYTTKDQIAGADEFGFLAFGHKLGRYTLGLHGVPLEAGDTTVDLWYTRTFRRWTGRLMEGPIGNEGIVAGVGSEDERQAIFRVTGALVKENPGLTAGDVQAVLWFYEKRLWGDHGIRTEEGSNSTGAKKLLSSLGIDGAGGAGDNSGAAAQSGPEVDPLTVDGPWRKGTVTATLEDDTTTSVEAGDAIDFLTRKIAAVQQILDCVNAS